MAREWERTRAMRYPRERTEQANVRVYPSLKERLQAAAKALEDAEQVRYGHVILVNAIIDRFAPSDLRETEELLRRFAFARKGIAEPEPDSRAAA